MPTFSANLGFLWTDLPLPDAIRAAGVAGFAAVECHWPYDYDPAEVTEALDQAGLPMLGLNTWRGDAARGDMGLSAIPNREAEARAAIDQAIAYAVEIDAGCVHVMAGFANGADSQAVFLENLRYACDRAAAHKITILIEPLNSRDAPGYFLTTTDQAKAIIAQVAAPNLKLMFDCYHVQIMEGDLNRKLAELAPLIGHIQFASVPDRGTPDHGEIDYAHVFRVIDGMGWPQPLGAEYRPGGDTGSSLGWMENFR